MIPFPRFPDGQEGLHHGLVNGEQPACVPGRRAPVTLLASAARSCEVVDGIGLLAILRLEHQTRRNRAGYHLTFYVDRFAAA